MPARRDFLRYGLAAALTAAGVATPLSLQLTSKGITLAPADALAKNGNGGGNGGGGGPGPG